MIPTPVTVCLPTADRRTSYDFYRHALELEPIGELADDGVPEPLQFVVNDRLRIMLIPTGGFGWITGDRDVAPAAVSECVLSVDATDESTVDEIVTRARGAGAGVVAEPARQPWGYAGSFADPDGHVWMFTAGTLGSD